MLDVADTLQLEISGRKSPLGFKINGQKSEDGDFQFEDDDKNKIRESIINQNNTVNRANRS